jgi:Skp family chaperone for outer membrane proteins
MRNSTAFFLLSVAMTAPLQGMATTKNTLSVAQSNDSMQSFSFRPGFIDGQMIAFNTKECKIEMNSCKEKQDNFFKEMQQKEQELILGHNELAAKQSTLTGPALKKEQKKLVEKERKAKEEFEEGKLELQTELLEATEKVNGVITKTAIQFAHANGLSMVQDKNMMKKWLLLQKKRPHKLHPIKERPHN